MSAFKSKKVWVAAAVVVSVAILAMVHLFSERGPGLEPKKGDGSNYKPERSEVQLARRDGQSASELGKVASSASSDARESEEVADETSNFKARATDAGALRNSLARGRSEAVRQQVADLSECLKGFEARPAKDGRVLERSFEIDGCEASHRAVTDGGKEVLSVRCNDEEAGVETVVQDSNLDGRVDLSYSRSLTGEPAETLDAQSMVAQRVQHQGWFEEQLPELLDACQAVDAGESP